MKEGKEESKTTLSEEKGREQQSVDEQFQQIPRRQDGDQGGVTDETGQRKLWLQ